jgi:hypothetical protein|tara:strand:- start:106 stop:516 length:411 start_codon:yes stop_codon:yes gene_type:complete
VRSLLQKAQAQWSGLGKKRPDTNPTKDTDLPSRDDFDYNPMGIVGVGGVKDVGEVGNVGSPGVGDNHENGEAFCGHRRQWLLHRVNTVKAALKVRTYVSLFLVLPCLVRGLMCCMLELWLQFTLYCCCHITLLLEH